jgi:hypothetical protein
VNMKEKKFPGRGNKKLVWEPKVMRGRGLSQQEGILTLRFDYAHEQREALSMARSRDSEQGTEMPDPLKK